MISFLSTLSERREMTVSEKCHLILGENWTQVLSHRSRVCYRYATPHPLDSCWVVICRPFHPSESYFCDERWKIIFHLIPYNNKKAGNQTKKEKGRKMRKKINWFKIYSVFGTRFSFFKIDLVKLVTQIRFGIPTWPKYLIFNLRFIF